MIWGGATAAPEPEATTDGRNGKLPDWVEATPEAPIAKKPKVPKKALERLLDNPNLTEEQREGYRRLLDRMY